MVYTRKYASSQIKLLFIWFIIHSSLKTSAIESTCRGETRALIGGGGEYSYIRVLPDEFLLKLTLMTADFKRNSSGRTRRYEYSHPPPQLTL